MERRRTLDLLDARDGAVGRIWRSLEATSQPSYFLSWGWIEHWLGSLRAEERPALAVVHDGHEPLAAFFLAKRKVRRNLVLQSNALYLNATGSDHDAEAAIVHNGMLTVPGVGRSLAGILDLLPADWDELHLPAIDRNSFDDLSPLASRYKISYERDELAPVVDLDLVRRGAVPRVTTLAADIDVDIATSREDALALFDELADDASEFHRSLIASRIALGEIQLMRVHRDGVTLGRLYNFVHRGRVHGYRERIVPGAAAACHAAAIAYNARAGHAMYELPPSAQPDALATSAERLVWVRIQRPLLPTSIESTARRWYDAMCGRPALAV